jgi:hypothetical protein
MRIVAPLVGRQLDQGASALACPVDGPGHHRRAATTAAPIRRYTHRFDLRPPTAAAAETRDEGKLKAADNVASLDGDQLAVVGIGFDRRQRSGIGRIQRDGLAFSAERIVGEQRYDGRQVARHGVTDQQRRVG